MTIPASDFHVLQTVCKKIFDKKGFNILALDVRGVCLITDYFIIAEGNVDRHLQALSGHLVDALAALGR